jgi:hypothetical protein
MSDIEPVSNLEVTPLTPEEAWEKVGELVPDIKTKDGRIDFKKLLNRINMEVTQHDDIAINGYPSVRKLAEEPEKVTLEDHQEAINYLSQKDRTARYGYPEGNKFRDAHEERQRQLEQIEKRLR